MADPISLIAGPVIGSVISLTVDFIRKEYHLQFDVEEEVKKLEENLNAIQCNLRDSDGIPLATIGEGQQNWLIKLRDAAHDAQDVLEMYAAKHSRLALQKRRMVVLPWLRREATQNIKEITSRIDGIFSEGKNFTWNQNPANSTQQTREAGPIPNTSHMYGRQDEKSNIIRWLTTEEFDIEDGEFPSVCSITGMAGIGKTTLAQFIYKDEIEAKHFTNLIWVDVKRDFVLERVGMGILENVSKMKIELNAWASVQERLGDLLKGKKFLLVLDDLWKVTTADWGNFHQLLKNGEKGSRVLVTSRTDEIETTIRARKSIALDRLPEKECWSLFAKIAFGGQSPSTDKETIGRQIVQKCDKLPLAINAMASMLYSCTDLHKWRSIERNGIWRTEQENARNAMPNSPALLPALRLSYEYLPSHLKECFIYCCIFPKGYMLDKSDLVRLWLAEGYADSSEDGRNYFDILRSRYFFQPLNIDNKERYRIHDLFHDLAASVSGKSSCRVEDDESCSVPENSRHISLFCKDVQHTASEILRATKLRTILLPVNHSRNFSQGLAKIFRTLKYLRVLDLSSTIMTKLPGAVGNLILLRYLDLSHTEIQRLPDSVCSLINLQTLKLLGCIWLYELPDGFRNLTNLCHLELDEMFWNKCTSVPPGIGALTNLQNLHFFRVGGTSMHGVEQLQRLNSITGKLHISKLENTASTTSTACLQDKENLEELVLEWSDGRINLQDPGMQETVLEELKPHSNLRKLQICRYKGIRLPNWMSNGSIGNLTEVSFSSCVHIKILSLGSLPHLQKLHLKGMQSLEEWPEMYYPTLYRLQISNCPMLKKLPRIIPRLQIMKIKKCDVLEELPVTPSLTFLVLINNIMLKKWNEAIVQETTAEGISGPKFSSYEKVLELQIKNCPRLSGLPERFAPQKLEINCCPLIETLPNEDYSRRLQHLALDGCNDRTLVEAIPRTSSAYSLVISNIANLISLPVSISLSGLKALYINSCADLESLSSDGAPLSGFTALTLLSVCGCPKLTTFTNSLLPSSLEYLIIKNCLNLKSFGPHNCLMGLSALRDLQLEDCPQIMSFPDDGLPASLKRLCIQRCPLLSQRFNDGGPYDRMLAQIADVDIDSI